MMKHNTFDRKTLHCVTSKLEDFGREVLEIISLHYPRWYALGGKSYLAEVVQVRSADEQKRVLYLSAR